MKIKTLDILLILSLIWIFSRLFINIHLEKMTIINLFLISWGSIPLLIFLIYNWILMIQDKQWIYLILGIIIWPVTMIYYFVEVRKIISNKKRKNSKP